MKWSYKPDPGLFLHAATALGVAPECCAVVEDSVPGTHAGLAAGMRVYALIPSVKLGADLAQQVCAITDLTAPDLQAFCT